MNQEDKRALSILHLAMSMGLILILIVFLFFAKDGFEYNISTSPDMYLIIGVVLAFSGIVVSQILFNKSIGDVFSAEEQSADKIRAAYIVRWALLEGPGLVNAIFYFLTDNFLHVFLAIFMWCMLLLARPNVS